MPCHEAIIYAKLTLVNDKLHIPNTRRPRCRSRLYRAYCHLYTLVNNDFAMIATWISRDGSTRLSNSCGLLVRLWQVTSVNHIMRTAGLCFLGTITGTDVGSWLMGVCHADSGVATIPRLDCGHNTSAKVTHVHLNCEWPSYLPWWCKRVLSGAFWSCR